MTITVDLTQLAELTTLPLDQMLWRLIFWYFGWLPLAIAFLWGAVQMWLYYIQHKWDDTQKNVILAIDIPNANEQSPRAVENLFAYLHGAQTPINLVEKWWEGKFQLSFAFEIVSIEGYIQFLIVTPESLKDFVETAVYAQYPDAEISQVEDYVGAAPDHYPDPDYDIWGTEFILTAHESLPIRTYKEFEHQLGEPETTYRDPMASLMDVMSSLKKGEQLWFQIMVRPAGYEWPATFEKEIGKILGEVKPAAGLLGMVISYLGELVGTILGQEAPEKKKEDEPLKMMNLKPEQKKRIEAIQEKKNRIGYEIKIRGLYLARKDVMNKPKAVNGMVGYLKQFSTNDLNGFMPDFKTKTSTAYLQAESRLNVRKNRFIRNYKNRSVWRGRQPYILTTEELASLWHFPIEIVVRAPLLQRAAAKRMEPPMHLPIGEKQVFHGEPETIFSADYETAGAARPAARSDEDFLEFLNDNAPAATGSKVKDEPPGNLPTV